MRSETFPFPERFAHGVTPLGPLCYFDSGAPAQADDRGAEAAPAIPIILVHALGTDMTQWEYVAPVLAHHTRVIGLDLPGCGRSAKPRHKYSLAGAVNAVIGLLNYLGIERAILFGHSFGGAICADAAIHHPSRAAGLVLMNTSGFTRFPRALQVLGRAAFHPYIVAPLMSRGVTRVLRQIFAAQNDRTEIFVQRIMKRPDPRYAWEFAHYAAPLIQDLMNDVLDHTHRLTMPTLVIWGLKDQLLRFQGVGDWLRKLPRARLVTIANCGHMPNLEHPEAVNTAAVTFLHEVHREAKGQRAQAPSSEVRHDQI